MSSPENPMNERFRFIGYKIVKKLQGVYASLEGKYTRVDLPVGTICYKTGRSQSDFDPGVVVSCLVDGNVYTHITLGDNDKDPIFVELSGGRRRNRRSTKKARRNRRRSTRKN
jgi:hypothetical protein